MYTVYVTCGGWVQCADPYSRHSDIFNITVHPNKFATALLAWVPESSCLRKLNLILQQNFALNISLEKMNCNMQKFITSLINFHLHKPHMQTDAFQQAHIHVQCTISTSINHQRSLTLRYGTQNNKIKYISAFP